MSNVAFTSEHVTNNIARRSVAEMESNAQENARMFAQRLLIPIAQRLSSSEKLRRGVLPQMCRKIVSELQADPNVIMVEFDSGDRKKLSANEDYRLAYVMTSASAQSSDWVQFTAAEVFLTRRELDVNSTTCDFRIHRHALARFMQRELQPTETLFGKLESALRASVTLGNAVATECDTANIALPIGNALLLGRVRVTDAHKYPAKKMKVRFGKTTEVSDDDRPMLFDDARILVEIMTYVDFNSMTPSRERLHEMLTDFVEANQLGIRQVFDATYFEGTSVNTNDIPRLKETMAAAIEGSRAVVTSPEWKNFEASVGSCE